MSAGLRALPNRAAQEDALVQVKLRALGWAYKDEPILRTLGDALLDDPALTPADRALIRHGVAAVIERVRGGQR